MDLVIAVIMAIVLIIARVPLFEIFCEDVVVVNIGARMMCVITPFYFVYVFTDILSNALRGMGDVVVPMLITVVGICVMRVSWIMIVSKLYPVMEVIIFNYPVTWIISGLAFIFYYKYRIKRFEAEIKNNDNL